MGHVSALINNIRHDSSGNGRSGQRNCLRRNHEGNNMHTRRWEGMPIYGELYHKQAMIKIRLEKFGPEYIQKEINELMTEIILRTDILSDYGLEPILKKRED
jgi:hypothetical protein